MKWLKNLYLKKMAPPGSSVLPWRPSYSCVLPILSKITVVNGFFMWNYPKFHMEKSSRTLIIYASSLPVVLYLAALLQRVHSVPVWLVAVMRLQGGDGVFLLMLESNTGTAFGKNSVGVEEFRLYICHNAGVPSLLSAEPCFLTWNKKKHLVLVNVKYYQPPNSRLL